MDFNALVDKYWAGESSLEEEQQLRSYVLSDKVSDAHKDLVPLFQLFEDQAILKLEKELDLNISEPKTIDINSKKKTRYLFPKLTAIAASMAVLVMFMTGTFQPSASSYVNNKQINDQEAYEITRDALAFLGANYEKGSSPMKHLKEFEHTAIFKF